MEISKKGGESERKGRGRKQLQKKLTSWLTPTMSHQREIDLEFQPNLPRILVPNVNIETTTVDEALAIFSDQAGMVRTSIKRAIPYRPVFSDRLPSGILSHYAMIMTHQGLSTT